MRGQQRRRGGGERRVDRGPQPGGGALIAGEHPFGQQVVGVDRARRRRPSGRDVQPGQRVGGRRHRLPQARHPAGPARPARRRTASSIPRRAARVPASTSTSRSPCTPAIAARPGDGRPFGDGRHRVGPVAGRRGAGDHHGVGGRDPSSAPPPGRTGSRSPRRGRRRRRPPPRPGRPRRRGSPRRPRIPTAAAKATSRL